MFKRKSTHHGKWQTLKKYLITDINSVFLIHYLIWVLLHQSHFLHGLNSFE